MAQARVILVRHGQTLWNEEERWQGQKGTGLSTKGRQQCLAAAEALAGMGVEAIYSSDLERARESAQIIAERLNLPVKYAEALRERAVGEWNGLTDEEVKQRFPQERAAHLAHPGTFAAPGGESREDVLARAAQFIEQVVADHAGQVVLIVAHAGVIKAMVCHALHAPVHAWPRMDVDNGSITIIEGQPGRLRLARLNDAYHLRGM
jgi:broad specificity phosphatase PhoE